MKGLAEDDPSEDVEECLPLVDWQHWMAAIWAISTNSSGDFPLRNSLREGVEEDGLSSILFCLTIGNSS